MTGRGLVGALLACLLIPWAWADDGGSTSPPLGISDEGGAVSRPVLTIDCVGAGIACSFSGITGTLTVSGAGSTNSFETIAVPAGTNPVADSATDTLTITETSPLVITGTAGTDTIDITMDTSPASAATVVGTGRTLTGGTGIAALGDLSADRTVTLDLTELSSATLGAGSFTTLTFDAGATDPVMTAGNGILTIAPGGSDLTVSDDVVVNDADPFVEWRPSSGQAFELNANASQFMGVNKTTGAVWFRYNGPQATMFPGQTWDFTNTTVKGLVPPKVYSWPGPAMLPLEFSADAIPPIVKNAGTNVDSLSVDYDDSTTECRTVIFQIPDNLDTTAKWTFKILYYPATAAASKNVNWALQTVDRTSGQTWDAALTKFGFPASVPGSSADITTLATRAIPSSDLGAASGDWLLCQVCRYGGESTDTLVGDAKLLNFSVTIPVLR